MLSPDFLDYGDDEDVGGYEGRFVPQQQLPQPLPPHSPQVMQQLPIEYQMTPAYQAIDGANFYRLIALKGLVYAHVKEGTAYPVPFDSDGDQRGAFKAAPTFDGF